MANTKADAIQASISKAADQAGVNEEEFDLDWLGETQKPSQMGDPKQIGLYASPGSGKTWLAASICEVEGYYPVLIIDTEESTVGTVANFPDDRITIVQVDNAADFDKLIANLINKEHPFKTVIVDTMGNAMDRKEWAIMSNPPKTQSGADDTQKAWGLLYSWAKKVIDGLRSADFATILIFHEKEEKDSVGNNYSRVWINGAAKKYIPSKPDLFGLLVAETDDNTGKTERTIYFGADTSRATKSRFESLGLPSKVKNPTMSKIINTIRDARKNQEA